jgi:hypothetical protein
MRPAPGWFSTDPVIELAPDNFGSFAHTRRDSWEYAPRGQQRLRRDLRTRRRADTGYVR